MEIYQSAHYFEVTFPYNPWVVKAIKRIQGARWDGSRKCWFVPLIQRQALEKLYEKHTSAPAGTHDPEQVGEIPPMPELADEYKDILSSELLRAPYHYQEQGIAFNLQFKRVLNGDDMGGGKTTTTIATIVAAGLKNKPGLIVCKGSGKYMWQREFDIVAGMKSIIMTDSIKNTWHIYNSVAGNNVFITNYESLEKFFVKSITTPKNQSLKVEHIEWKLHPKTQQPLIDLFEYVVLDESHEIRNEETIKSVICVGLGIGKEWKFALSGTPIVNKTKDIYAQLNFLGRTKNTRESRRKFIDRYCGGGSGHKSTNSRELHYKLRLNCYFRRNTHEFGIDLPPLTLQLVYSEISTRKEYDFAVKNLRDYLQQYRGKTAAEVDKSMNAQAMVLIGVLLNISARGKIREAIEEIDNALLAGKKIVVFINQKVIKEQLVKHYPQGLVISGEENAIQKNAAETAFNASKEALPIFVSIRAGGVGINLQEDCTDVLFIEHPWHPALYYQAAKRVHRNGVKGHVIAKNIIGKGTIDERIWEIIETKKDIADTITGNEDDIQKEVIDKIRDSLFNTKKAETF